MVKKNHDNLSKKKRAQEILRKLKKLFPDAKMILHYSNPWECLVAVQLSAQCTDAQVNKVTAQLFKKYRTLADYADAALHDFEKDIFSTGFYRNKAKNILAAAKMIQDTYGGKVPHTMEELLKVPGVARKTANVVLGNAYSVVEGIAVDTHVRRICQKLGLTRCTNPDKIERDLMLVIPKKEWFRFTYYIIEYGRRFCSAKKHAHDKCPLSKFHP